MTQFCSSSVQAVFFVAVPARVFLLSMYDQIVYIDKINENIERTILIIKLYKSLYEQDEIDSAMFIRKLQSLDKRLTCIYMHLSIFTSHQKTVVMISKKLLLVEFLYTAISTLLIILCSSISVTTDFRSIITPVIITLLVANSLLPIIAVFYKRCERTYKVNIPSLVANLTDVKYQILDTGVSNIQSVA